MRIAFLLAAALVPTVAVTASAEVIGRMATAEPLSEARIAALPTTERAPWLAYWKRSQARMAADKAALASERKGLGSVPAGPPQGSTATIPLNRDPAWYGSSEARGLADNIVSFQTPAGGWGKNQDRTGPLRARGQSFVIIETLPPMAAGDIKGDEHWAFVGTIDNGATTTELRFLARVQQAAPGAMGEKYRAAFARGLRYLLEAQYPNGGWPQVYPLQGGYHDAVTYNDDALTDVVDILTSAGGRQDAYAFVPAALAGDARVAVDRAIALIVRTQVIVAGKRTGWGQQHDALTLAPVGARNFEPVSLSSYESAALLAFLMRLTNPNPGVVRAVHDGVSWLEATGLRDIEWTAAAGPEGRHRIARPGAGPIWSRFYDMATMRPIFGDRDKTIHDDANELSLERRNGYSWYGTDPARAIRLYQDWAAANPCR